MGQHKAAGTVTIPNGASLSGAINLGDKTLCAILAPASWTAAPLSFQASDDQGLTWQNMFDSTGAEISIPSAAVVAGQRISIAPSIVPGIDFLKLRSGTAAAPVNQTADRALTIVSRKIYPLTFPAFKPAGAAAPANSATFLGFDNTTIGTWIGVYGQDGGNIMGEAGISYPGYITTGSWQGEVNPLDYGDAAANSNNWPQRPGAPGVRTGHCYYTTTDMTIDLVITDGQSHKMAFYSWDPDGGRSCTVSVTDLSNNILDGARSMDTLNTQPKWAVWRISGSVRFKVHATAYSILISALMFSP